ncbi:hypothetical protein [Deinococcus planocerae]|uniref:hypothetical protein n=1 Tax=Deinococcus planocerae TaxID=1737569 RepID=UPI000C7EB469|nr:hypothetical protein [Deinococcus planocerae]
MNIKPASLLLLLLLAACAPVTTAQAPTTVTTTAQYRAAARANEDSPVLASVVSLAPAAPHAEGRQPWRAEEIQRNSLVLRSRAVVLNTRTFESTLRSLPYEMVFNVITANNVTTLTATYSSQHANTAQYIFDQLDKRFQRVK